MRVIADSIKCKLMEKKTLELRLQNHPEARTVLAPCFHSCMMESTLILTSNICKGVGGYCHVKQSQSNCSHW